MTDGPRSAVRRDRPHADVRVAALEAENAALRRALARAGLPADRHGGAAAVRRGPEAFQEAAVRAAGAFPGGSPWRLIEAAPNPYLVLHPDPPRFTIAAVSDAYLRTTMTRRNDIVGRGVFEAFTDDPGRPAATGVRNLRASLHWALATRAPDRMPVQRYDVRQPGGAFEERHWSPFNVPVVGPDGGVEAILHHVEDVTEFGPLRERSEAMEAEALRQAHAVARANADLDAANAALRGSEERLRAAEARQTFLLRLSDALRPLHDPDEMQAEACRLLGAHLRVAQVGFGRIDAAQERVTVRRDWNDGRVAPVVGTWRMDDFGPAFAADLRRGATVAVPDIALDPRTGAPGVAAAYAGIGARAVLDVPLVKGGRMAAMLFIHHPEPRPWSPAEVEVVEETCERLWAAVERAHAEEALRGSEARFSALTRASSDVLYRLNADWTELRQLSGGGFIADTTDPNPDWIDAYIPPEDRPLIRAAIDDAVRGGGVYDLEHRVRRADGGLGWAHSRAVPILGEDGRIAEWFGAASDVTGRKATEARLAALADLGDRLRDLRDPAEMVRTAAEVTGRALGATRAGVGTVDAAEETIHIEHDWTGVPAASVTGVHRLQGYWAGFADDLRRGEAVAVGDVAQDGRTAPDADNYAAVGVRACLHAPVLQGGRVVAILYVHDAVPRRWTADEVAFARGVAERAWAAVERARAEAALRDSEGHRRAALDAARLGTFEWDLATGAVALCQRSREIFGFVPGEGGRAEEVFGRMHPGDLPRVHAEATAAAAAKARLETEYRVLLPGDGERVVASFGDALPGAAGRAARMVGVFADITERRLAEEHRALLVNEMNHRAKNALAVVQAVLRLTKAADVPAFVRSVEGRVAALARAHTLLADRQWAGSSLHDLVKGELAPFMAGRVTINGPAVTLPAVAAQPVAMAVHELATNAAKHGALSIPAGSVAVTWRIDGAHLSIRWAESGGPPVAGSPKRSGFGSRLLDGTIRKQLRGTVERAWDASGLVCHVVVPLGEAHGDR